MNAYVAIKLIDATGTLYLVSLKNLVKSCLYLKCSQKIGNIHLRCKMGRWAVFTGVRNLSVPQRNKMWPW